MAREKLYGQYGLKIVGCLVLSATLSWGIPVYAAELNSKDQNEENILVSNIENQNDALINSEVKEFNNLNKVRKYIGFDYKVPDYTLDCDCVNLIRVFNPLDGNNRLEIYYSRQDNENWYSLDIFKSDPVETLTKEFKESFENLQVSTLSKNIGGINGKYITLTDCTYGRTEMHGSCKYFVWKNDDVWYCMNCNNNSEEPINENEISKVANSLKNPKDVINVSYLTNKDINKSSEFTMSIYDKDDLENAKVSLGYSPILPLKIEDNIKISSAFVDINESGKSLFCYYSYNKGNVAFIQTKDCDNYEYEDVLSTGYARENGGTNKIKADKLSISGIDVFRYVDNGDNKIVYQWKKDNMYYFFEIYYYGAVENADNIVKEFANAKPIE